MSLRRNIILILSLIPSLFSYNPVAGGQDRIDRNDGRHLSFLHSKFSEHHYSNLDSALYFAKKAYNAAKSQGLHADEIKALNNIGKAYYTKGDYLLSLQASMEALQLSRRHKVPQELSESYNTIGLIYLAQNKYSTAIAEFRKSIRINSELSATRGLLVNFFNVAICYDYLGKGDSALLYLDRSKVLAGKTKNEGMLVMILNRRGEVYNHMGQYVKAKGFYEEALASPAASRWEQCFANTGLGKAYFNMEQHQQAIFHSKKGLELATELNAKWDIKNAAEVLSKAYAALGNYEQAYSAHLLFKRYEDSLMNRAKETEINYRHLLQQKAENQALARSNELEIQRNRFSRLVIIGISALCALLVAGAVIIYFKNRQKELLNTRLRKSNQEIALQRDTIERQNEELSKLNQTKDQLFSIMAHDLRGPISSIQQALHLMMEGSFSREEQDYILKSYYKEIVLVNNMMNNMLNWALGQQLGIKARLVTMDLYRSINEIMEVQHLIARNKGVALQNEIDSSRPWSINADPDQVRVIAQNLITNGIKFTNPGGTVRVYATEDTQYVHLHVQDTGVGIPPDKMNVLFKEIGKSVSAYGTHNESGTGIGLMLVKNFTEANGGRFSVQSKPSEGSHFTISFLRGTPYSS